MANPYCEFEGCDRFKEGATSFCATHNAASRKKKRNDLKPKKQYSSIAPVGTENKFEASDGAKYNEQQIRQRLNRCYNNMADSGSIPIGCAAYPNKEINEAIDHDHTIAKARCKEIKKTELIWDENNIEFTSRTAHQEWERYKSGKFIKHANFEKRMAYMKLHDPEGWEKRMQIVAAFQQPTQTI